jgi:hypothetical protein
MGAVDSDGTAEVLASDTLLSSSGFVATTVSHEGDDAVDTHSLHATRLEVR